MKSSFTWLATSFALSCGAPLDAVDETPAALTAIERSYTVNTVPVTAANGTTIDVERVKQIANDFLPAYLEISPSFSAKDHDDLYKASIAADLIPSFHDKNVYKVVLAGSYPDREETRAFVNWAVALNTPHSANVIGVNFDDFFARRNRASTGDTKELFDELYDDLVAARLITFNIHHHARKSFRVMATIYCSVVSDGGSPMEQTNLLIGRANEEKSHVRDVLTDVVVYDQARGADGKIGPWFRGDIAQMQTCVDALNTALGPSDIAVRVGVYEAGPQYKLGSWLDNDSYSTKKKKEIAGRLQQIDFADAVQRIRGTNFFIAPITATTTKLSYTEGSLGFLDAATYPTLYQAFECLGGTTMVGCP